MMVNIIEYDAVMESGAFIYRCSVCGYVNDDPFPKIMPYKDEIRKCPLCESIVKRRESSEL